MPTIRHVWQLIQHDDFAFSIDLHNAYLHIPIVKYHHHFLWFVWHSMPYLWKVLHFRLATAPRVFTALAKAILFLCYHKAFHIAIYLDDILFWVCSKHIGKRAHLFLYSLLVCLGLQINFSKSDLHLTQTFCFLGLCWDTGILSACHLPPDKLADIQQLSLSLLQNQHVTVHRVMSFLGKATFCTNGCSQPQRLCCVIQSDVLTVYHSLAHLFSTVHFPFPPYVKWNSYLICNRAQFLCNFHFLMWLLLLMPYPLIWPFIFRDLVYPYWLVDLGQVLCVWLILPCRSFRPLPWCCIEWLSTYLVRWLPFIWITALLRLICVITVIQCLPFLSRLACWILSLTDKHGINLISAYIPTHLNVGADYLSHDWMLPEWHLLHHVAQAAFHLWGLPEVDLLASPYHSMPALSHLGISITSGGLGIEFFNHPWMFQVSYVLLPPGLLPLVLSTFLVEHVKDQLRCLILVASCWMEAPWFPTVLNMLADIPWVVSHQKRSHHGCFGRPGAKGSAISVFYPLAAQWCVLHRQGFSSSVCQPVVGSTWASTSKVYQQCWKEWAGWCAQQSVPNNAIPAPKLANFLAQLFQVGLAWHTTGIYHSAISVFLEPHYFHEASNHPVFSKLMHPFY